MIIGYSFVTPDKYQGKYSSRVCDKKQDWEVRSIGFIVNGMPNKDAKSYFSDSVQRIISLSSGTGDSFSL